MKQPERTLDVTPPGWTPPAIDELPALVAILSLLFPSDGIGYTMRRDGIQVHVLDLDGIPLAARARRARLMLFAVRQQQLIASLHETGKYDEARAAMVARAGRAMRAVRSHFVAEHQGEPDDDAPY